MNGIIIVDKPTDWTSHDVVAKLRGTLRIRRVGHGGTLDPMATGVLPVFVGRATRAAEFCENAQKEYIAGLRLGIVTDTQDITGTTLYQAPANLTADEVRAVLPRFSGTQKQIPPMYSAIKKNGKKLYELARKGIEIERPAREIFISAIELLGQNGEDFELRIVCSKGTYIRTLCHDIGAALGTGAAMSALRRTAVGGFNISDSRTLDEILDSVAKSEISKHLVHIDSLFSNYPPVTLDGKNTQKVRNGAVFQLSSLSDGKHRLYGPGNEFLALCEVVGGSVKIIKGFFEPTTIS